MVYCKRVITLSLLAAAGVLSACAHDGSAVITRSWQIDHVLAEKRDECRYGAISYSLSEELKEKPGGADVLENLDSICPELTIQFSEVANGTEVAALSASDTGTSDTPTSDGPADNGPSDGDTPDGGGSDTSDGGDSTGGGDTSDGGDSSGGGDTSDGGDSTGGGDTSDGGDSSGGGDTSGGGNNNGNGNGKGSKGNNGGGNGSEGSSPGQGSGANHDE